MIINTKIRKEVLSLLQAKMSDVEHFYNGRPSFIDIDEEQVAVAVYLDDINCHGDTVCSDVWQAKLHITVYIKSIESPEDELDEFADKIISIVSNHSEFTYLGDLSLAHYRYEQDENQRTWHMATLVFEIEYPHESPFTGD